MINAWALARARSSNSSTDRFISASVTPLRNLSEPDSIVRSRRCAQALRLLQTGTLDHAGAPPGPAAPFCGSLASSKGVSERMVHSTRSPFGACRVRRTSTPSKTYVRRKAHVVQTVPFRTRAGSSRTEYVCGAWSRRFPDRRAQNPGLVKPPGPWSRRKAADRPAPPSPRRYPPVRAAPLARSRLE